jgi:general secretion pathway protein L
MHFAYRIEAEGGQAVAAVRRTLLEQWLDDLGARGVYPDRMLADAAALPWAPGSLTVLVEGEGTLIRAERSEASSLETDELGTWLGLAAAERGPGVRVVLHDEAGRVGSLPPALAVDRINPAPPALAWLAPGAFAPDGVDLLSGKYAARHRGQPVRQLWRMAALFLAAVVVLAFAQAAAEQWRLHRRLVLLEQEMAALYRQSFPGAKQARGSSAQMRAELERASTGRGSGGALALLKRLAPILTASTQYTVKALEYRSGTLDLVIIADSVATLDSVRERVLSLGLGANLSAVSAGELGTEGKLRVEAPR